MLDLPVAGLRGAIREDAAVHAEEAVVGLVAERATKAEEAHAVLVHPKAVVNPLPNRRAKDDVRGLDGVLIVLQVAHRVGHVVRVFGDVERLLRVRLRGLPPAPIDGGILAAVHVGDGPVALVVRRARRVEGLHRLLGGAEVLARARLVAVGPDDDARMVEVARDHRDVAVDGRLLPALLVRERVLAVAVAVRLHVRLVDDVKAVDVAEVIPIVVLRIVRVADGVAVRLLHLADVLLVAAHRHEVAEHGIRLVAVRPFELDGLAVEVVARDAVHLAHLAHAEAEDRRDELLAVGKDELVAVGLFRAPRVDVLGDAADDALRREVLALQLNRLVVEVVEGERPIVALALVGDLEAPIALVDVRFRRCRRHAKVADALRRAREKPRAAEDAREAEHVLILQIRAVGIAVDLQGDRVLAGLHERRHVELGGRARVLREADVAAVHPQVEEGIDAVELEEDVAVLVPPFREREVAPIGADGIPRLEVREVLGRVFHDERAARHVLLEGIRDVRVDGGAPAALAVRAKRLPRRGDLDDGPRRDVEVGLVEIDGARGGVL